MVYYYHVVYFLDDLAAIHRRGHQPSGARRGSAGNEFLLELAPNEGVIFDRRGGMSAATVKANKYDPLRRFLSAGPWPGRTD